MKRYRESAHGIGLSDADDEVIRRRAEIVRGLIARENLRGCGCGRAASRDARDLADQAATVPPPPALVAMGLDFVPSERAGHVGPDAGPRAGRKRGGGRRPAGYRGVTPRPGGRFRARVYVGGDSTVIGTFDTAEEAARAYDRARRELGFGGPYNFGEGGGD